MGGADSEGKTQSADSCCVVIYCCLGLFAAVVVHDLFSFLKLTFIGI